MLEDMFDRLAAPFPPDAISWRVGSTSGDKSKGLALAYLDARDVMDRLDSVCGPGGWQDRYPHAGNKTVCEIGIKVGDEWIWKADGAGDTDVEAEKGALSDAFKRAAVRWGIGRYLYGLPSPWVKIEPMGRSYRIAESEYDKLAKLIAGYGGKPLPEPMSAACEAAERLLRSKADPADFRACWETNKAGWKEHLASREYAHLVAVMQEVAATFKPKDAAA
jgi:hypothetical protein